LQRFAAAFAAYCSGKNLQRLTGSGYFVYTKKWLLKNYWIAFLFTTLLLLMIWLIWDAQRKVAAIDRELNRTGNSVR